MAITSQLAVKHESEAEIVDADLNADTILDLLKIQSAIFIAVLMMLVVVIASVYLLILSGVSWIIQKVEA